MDNDHRPDVLDGGYADGTWTTGPIRCRMDGDDGRDDVPIGDATHVRVRSQRGASPRLAGRDRFARHDVSRRVAGVWSRVLRALHLVRHAVAQPASGWRSRA